MPFPDPGGPRSTALMPMGSLSGINFGSGAAGAMLLVNQVPGMENYNQQIFECINETIYIRSPTV